MINYAPPKCEEGSNFLRGPLEQDDKWPKMTIQVELLFFYIRRRGRKYSGNVGIAYKMYLKKKKKEKKKQAPIIAFVFVLTCDEKRVSYHSWIPL